MLSSHLAIKKSGSCCSSFPNENEDYQAFSVASHPMLPPSRFEFYGQAWQKNTDSQLTVQFEHCRCKRNRIVRFKRAEKQLADTQKKAGFKLKIVVSNLSVLLWKRCVGE